jgi:hypothetical protein
MLQPLHTGKEPQEINDEKNGGLHSGCVFLDEYKNSRSCWI